MAGEHVHNWALAALVARSPDTKAEIARRARLTPSQLGDLISGRRAGHSLDVRTRIADSLDENVLAITCWCKDRQGRHQEGQ